MCRSSSIGSAKSGYETIADEGHYDDEPLLFDEKCDTDIWVPRHATAGYLRSTGGAEIRRSKRALRSF